VLLIIGASEGFKDLCVYETLSLSTECYINV